MKLAIFTAAAVAFSAPAFAATYSPDTASASSEFSSNYVAENTINGSGLPSGFDSTSIHATYAKDNHWTTSATKPPVGQYIDWGFNAPATVGGLYIWNHLSNNIASNPRYEPIRFDLELFGAGGAVLKSFVNVALTPNTAGASEAFTLGAALAGVTQARFTVKQTEGSMNYTGLAEVLFSDSVLTGAGQLEPAPSVPLPGSVTLLGAALAGLGLMRRRA